MPRVSRAAIDAVVDMVHLELVDEASEEEELRHGRQVTIQLAGFK